jgi:hypothetical protein
MPLRPSDEGRWTEPGETRGADPDFGEEDILLADAAWDRIAAEDAAIASAATLDFDA